MALSKNNTDEQHQNTQESIKRDLIRLIVCAPTLWPLEHSGEWLAMLLGLRPAIILNGDANVPMIRNIFANRGQHITSHRNLIAVEELVLQRVHNEPDLAAFADWNSNRSVEVNLHSAWQHIRTLGKRSERLTGFLLGFPASSIRAFHTGSELRKRIPWITTIQPDEHWEAADLALLTDAKREVLEHGGAYEDPAISNAQWKHVYSRTDVRDLLKRRFEATDAELDFIASQQFVEIRSPFGDTMFCFSTFDGGASAEDVLLLKKRAHDACLHVIE